MTQTILRPNFTKNIHQHYIKKGKSLNIFGAEGHPQLLQTVCSNIVTIANQTNQKRVTTEMVEKAKDEVFEVNDMPMTIFWREFCEDEEREVIEQILANQTIIQESKEQRRALARLVDYGFITKEFEIYVPLFEKWLKERRDLIEI